MFKMNRGFRQQNINRRTKTLYHCLRKNKGRLKELK